MLVARVFPTNIALTPYLVLVGDQQLEEERRLAYVALSRARQKLIISFCLRDGSGNSLEPSRFLHEVPESLYVKNTKEGASSSCYSSCPASLIPAPPSSFPSGAPPAILARDLSASPWPDQAECERRLKKARAAQKQQEWKRQYMQKQEQRCHLKKLKTPLLEESLHARATTPPNRNPALGFVSAASLAPQQAADVAVVDTAVTKATANNSSLPPLPAFLT